MGVGILGALALIGGGTALQASSATKKRKQLLGYQQSDLPDTNLYTENYFGDLSQYEGQSRGMAMRANEDLTQLALSRQERALPGVRNAVKTGFESLLPLLRGELPPAVLENFRRSGNASSVGLGMGGSGFGNLNTALFGARGSLDAMKLGYSLLPTLLGAAPQFGTTSPAAFLEGIMTPAQQASTQLGVRGQNVSLAQTASGMKTGSEVWGGMLSGLGGMLLGSSMGSIGGAGGGMGMAAGAGTSGNGVSRLYGYGGGY